MTASVMENPARDDAACLSAVLSCGAFQAGVIAAGEIEVRQDVRAACESNVCRNYGRTWACPPASGTLDECRARIRQYRSLLLYSCKYPLEDSFDYEGMMSAWRSFKALSDRVRETVSGEIAGCLFLSNEGCGRCEVCTYPDAPCRHPDKMQPSIEGWGLLVADLAKRAGMRYINGKNTVTYFGGILMP